MFRLAKPVVSSSAKFELTGTDPMVFGVEVLGTVMDDKEIVTISDKAINPDMTCTAT